MKTIQIEMEAELHKVIKKKAIDAETTMKNFILDVLKKAVEEEGQEGGK